MNEVLCPTMACKKDAWNDMEFECGSFTIEDSRKLRARATLLSDTLTGSVNGANYVNQIITAEDKVRMYSEDYERTAVWKAPQNTRALDECGPFQPEKLKPRYVEDRFLYMYPMEMELAFCLPKLFPTWKKNMATNSGFRNRWRNEGFVPWLLNDVMINNAQLQLDHIIMKGDYKSPIKYLSQFDGLVKKIHNYAVSYIPEVLQINIPALGAGDYVHIAVGGQTTSIPFNTDNATTIGDIVTWLNTLLSQDSNEPYYSITTNNADSIWVAEKEVGWHVHVQAYINQNATYTWTSVDESCDDSSLVELIQSSGNRHSPLKDDFGPIDKGNFWDWICNFFYPALNMFDRMDGPDADQVVVFVSEQFMRSKDLALTNMTRAFKGAEELRTNVLGLRFVPNKRLKGSEYFATWAGNLQYATDLESDFTSARVWFEPNCEELRMKLRAKAGTDILYPGELISNIPCLNYNFQPPAEQEVYKYACALDCSGKQASSCPDCTPAFSWKVQADASNSYIVLENHSDCGATATVAYEVLISDYDGTTVTLNTANPDHTFTIAGATALDNMHVQITQTVGGLGDGCADKTLILTDTVTPEELEQI